MPLSAAMICLLCQINNIPASWSKCELASSLQWIGWNIHFRSGFIEIPTPKFQKFLGYLGTIGQSTRTSKRHLEKLIGLALWLPQLWFYMRIWIRHWYHDLYSIPATHYSIDNGDLSMVYLSGKRSCPRIRNPAFTTRTLSATSLRIIQHFIQWVSGLLPMQPLTPKTYRPGIAATDTCASGSTCEIGGFVRSTAGQSYWFSEIYHHSDFQTLSIELDPKKKIHQFLCNPGSDCTPICGSKIFPCPSHAYLPEELE